MKLHTLIRMTIAAALFAVALIAVGQTAAKPLPPPPGGFTATPESPSVSAMRKAGVADGVEAQKPNEGWPNCYVDPKITLRYGWTLSPGGDKSLEIMAKTPEDPVKVVGGIRDEPLGKRRYKGGVLWWRKTTTPAVGSSGACRDKAVITYGGNWVGYDSGRLVSVSVVNLYGSKETGQAWIDQYIDKLTSQ